jgi:PAS domain S-box-containing protein
VARRYGLALLLAAAATLFVRLVPTSEAHDTFLLLLAFPAATLLAAWIGGTGPGLLAGVLGLAASAVFVFPPIGTFEVGSPRDRNLMVIQTALSLTLCLSLGALRYRRHLEAEVAKEVARAEKKYRLLFERNPEPMGILDSTTRRMLSVNQGLIDKLGYTKNELLAMRTFDLGFPEDIPLSLVDIARRPPPGSEDIFKLAIWRLRKKDGATMYVDLHGTRLSLDSRDCELVVVRDITERVLLLTAMRDAEEKWRTLLERSTDCFLVIDENNRVGFASRSLAGLPLDRIWGREVEELVAPEDVPILNSHLESVRNTGAAVTVELRVRGANGRMVPHEGECLPIRRQGKVTLILVVLADVSRRREEEEQLRAAKEGAEVASRAKDRFIAALSHELRTPLTPVLAAASLATMRYPGAAPLLDVIRRNVEVEAHLIDDLLDASRIVSGKLRLEPQRVDVHSLLNRTMATCKPEADSKDLRVSIDLRATQPWLWADPVRLEQALLNIVQNAVKFTPPRGAITVESKDLPEHHLAITVHNTGRGIPKEDLTRIFLPFEQGGDTRRDRGLGLGLAISKGIIDAAGGTLTAYSAGPESGASFTIELPVRTGEPTGAPEVASPPAILGHPRILLVEDDRDTRETLRELLLEHGFEVVTADSVASAAREFGAHVFDLVLCDIGLPDGSGLDVPAKLRTIRPVRAVALSGYGMAEDVSRSRAAGFVAHLTKPISLERLEATLRKLIEPAGEPKGTLA